eukprot:gene14437-biopygen9605
MLLSDMQGWQGLQIRFRPGWLPWRPLAALPLWRLRLAALASRGSPLAACGSLLGDRAAWQSNVVGRPLAARWPSERAALAALLAARWRPAGLQGGRPWWPSGGLRATLVGFERHCPKPCRAVLQRAGEDDRRRAGVRMRRAGGR